MFPNELALTLIWVVSSIGFYMESFLLFSLWRVFIVFLHLNIKALISKIILFFFSHRYLRPFKSKKTEGFCPFLIHWIPLPLPHVSLRWFLIGPYNFIYFLPLIFIQSSWYLLHHLLKIELSISLPLSWCRCFEEALN